MELDRRKEDLEVRLVEAKIDGHIDVCAVRYEGIGVETRAIHARLKRIEHTLLAVAGAIMILLVNIALKIH